MSDPDAPGPARTAPHSTRTAPGTDPAASRTAPGEAAVTLDGVSVVRDGHLIWSEGTFSIPAGSLTAVIGPNGAGKTTMLEVILGLLPAASGTVRIFGKPQARAGDIAYVPQNYTAAAGGALRARDAVMLGLTGTRWGIGRTTAAQRQQIEEAMRAVDALDIIEHRLQALSGGQRQRVAIAQALVSKPRLLLLDEPLANLDLRNQREVVTLLDRLNSSLDVTIMLVVHDLNPLLPVLDGAVYLLDGHAHYDALDGVVDDALLTHLYGTPLHVVRTVQGDLFVQGEQRAPGSPGKPGAPGQPGEQGKPGAREEREE
ncbi:MAG: ATP-binding cassette domain-containing protein [Leucobacter sp.]